MAKKTINITCFDPFSKISYNISDNKIEKKDFDKLAKLKTFFISYVKNKDIITVPISIVPSGGLTEKDLEEDEVVEGLILQKVYQELVLDQSIDYKIKYIKQENTGGAFIYDTFIVNNDLIYGENAEFLSKAKFLDCVALAPLLFAPLYKQNILSSSNVDCFIYFQEDDAFLVIYRNGRFYQSKSLTRYSLSYINNKFCELTGEKLSNEEFFNKLKSYGLNLENKERLVQVLDDIFYFVSDLVNSISKISGLTIDNVYVSSDCGNISGLDKFIQDRLLLRAYNFEFNLPPAFKDSDMGYLHSLMILYAEVYVKNPDSVLNFSSFIRPPNFLKRPGGVFLVVIIFAIIASLAYPGYQYTMGYFMQTEINNRQAEIDTQKARINTLNLQLLQLSSEINATKAKITSQNKELEVNEQLLQEIFEKKKLYPMKAVALYDLSNYINKANIKIQIARAEDNNMTISLKGANDKDITQLMDNISQSEKYKVGTRQIILKNGAYDSNITVELK